VLPILISALPRLAESCASTDLAGQHVAESIAVASSKDPSTERTPTKAAHMRDDRLRHLTRMVPN
jgi:hypothetical protein